MKSKDITELKIKAKKIVSQAQKRAQARYEGKTGLRRITIRLPIQAHTDLRALVSSTGETQGALLARLLADEKARIKS